MVDRLQGLLFGPKEETIKQPSEELDESDLLEKGLSSAFNPSFFKVSQRAHDRKLGLHKHFINVNK